jgi:hypothetical protein
MIQNKSILGKILLILCLPIFLIANVNAYLDKKVATKGEVVTYTINAVGEDIKIPYLKSIGGNDIISTSTSSQVRIINSKITKQQSTQYQFIANNKSILKSIKIQIANKDYYTQELTLDVKEPMASKDGDDYQLKIMVDKTKVYVGEAIRFTLEFKYKIGLGVIDLKLDELKQNNFIIKRLKSMDPIQKGDYSILVQEYIIFPQISSNLVIDKQLINVATRDPRSRFIRWNKVYSNSLNIEVLELPNGLNIQGEYKLDATIDKNTVDINKPINFTVSIKGFGNINDIEDIKLDLKDELVYSSKPQLKEFIKNGRYGGEFIQKFSIIGNKDFIIPSIKFKYFDTKINKEKVLSSKEFTIKVNALKSDLPQIQTNINTSLNKPEIIVKEENYIKYMYGLIGVLIGLLIAFVSRLKKNKKRVERPIDIQIKKAKNDKELYEVLLPYSNDNEIKDIINLLEMNIYQNKNFKINKKELINIIK